MVAKYAILGSPVAHSLSPKIHTAAYRALGLDWSYESFDVTAENLGSFLTTRDDFSGFSLTMPLKDELVVLAKLHRWEVDDTANALEAGNTFLRSSGSVKVFNTDVFGARQALSTSGLVDPSSLAILGAGATARSVSMAVLTEFPSISAVRVFSRDQVRSRRLLDFMGDFGSDLEVQWLPLAAAEDFGGAELTINTLPPDVSAVTEVDQPLSGGWIFDVNYNPWPSVLASVWPQSQRISGIEMLIWQALAQIRIFRSGNFNDPLDSEDLILESMRNALL